MDDIDIVLKRLDVSPGRLRSCGSSHYHRGCRIGNVDNGYPAGLEANNGVFIALGVPPTPAIIGWADTAEVGGQGNIQRRGLCMK